MFGTRRARWAWRTAPACMLVACLVAATPAIALTMAAPVDFTGPADVSVALSAEDPVGPVSLWDGDLPLGSRTPTGGLALFEGVSLTAGPHLLRATVQGGDRVLASTEAAAYSWSVPGPPSWEAPGSKAVISPCTVRLRAGASTATMTLTVNGRVVSTVACSPGELLTFKGVRLPSHRPVLAVLEESLTGETATYSRTLTRYEFPYSTCIVIDKSEYRLYWVKNQQLIKKYPIAHGRHNWTPVGVWKVLAKYKTSGIYGPRKMRMFRRVGKRGRYRYVYTKYGIHGTNQPWVIGTQASHGCIRMYNRDVLQLWPQVRIGTFVVTRK
jgi:hypothetical protein